MSTVERLRVASGRGRLVRRASALLFVPQDVAAGAELVEAFLDAPPTGVLDATSAVVVARSFDVPAFAVVAWTSRVEMLVFGDLQVRTDHAAVPMVSGAGSTTWVEHTLRGVGDRVRVMVDAPDDDDLTDLRDGVVPAGGFALDVAVDVAMEGSSPPARTSGAGNPTVAAAITGTDAAQRRLDAAPDDVAAEDVGPDDVAADEGEDRVPAPPSGRTDVPRPAEAVPSSPGPSSSPDDALVLPPVAGPQDGDSLAAIRSAVVGADDDPVGSGSPVAAAPSVPEPGGEAVEQREADDPGTSASSPSSTAAGSGGAGGAGGEVTSLVEAVACPRGHLSPAGAASCRHCGLDLSGAVATTVARPRLGMLRLDDGAMLPLDRGYRIGRRPRSGGGLTAAPIEGEKISRTHLEVTLRGWDVLVRDCDSTNGTWLATGPDDEFRRIEPDRTIMVEPGARIRVDQRVLTYDLDSPESG